ncbi:hypothetical protein AMTR_s00023p00118910 [Amborella trichopoda]|uniref:C2H2-type domain-containing protein n=1 Tax=Amborella trichopoda TaxID=13333 RepID=W1NJ93_AMBTC|nr:hypothetical protein AMTR_s00023p00118910 [Amborella trichopoda]
MLRECQSFVAPEYSLPGRVAPLSECVVHSARAHLLIAGVIALTTGVRLGITGARCPHCRSAFAHCRSVVAPKHSLPKHIYPLLEPVVYSAKGCLTIAKRCGFGALIAGLRVPQCRSAVTHCWSAVAPEHSLPECVYALLE